MTTTYTKTNILRRAALTLLALIMTCATAWAETVETYYIDENGTRHDVTATVVTTYMDDLGTDGETTWYVVNENIFLYGSNDQTHLHGNGNLIVTSEGTLQIIDMLGRIITNETSYYGVSTNGMAPGVYVLRLINGENVNTQKIVVR